MAITFEFTNIKVEIAPQLGELKDVVTRARYTYVGANEDGITGQFQGATPMPTPDSEHFKPFNELTEPEVVSWLEKVADKEHMQDKIFEQIERKITPMYVPVENPWDKTEE